MFTKSEEYLNLDFILDDDISTKETGEIFLLIYLAVSHYLKPSLNYKCRYKSTLYHRMNCISLN